MQSLILRLDGSEAFSAETRDVSSEGFFCFVDEPFAIGERLRCLILLPDPAGRDTGSGMCIDAQVEVIHILADSSRSLFGIGCQTHSFRIVPNGCTLASSPASVHVGPSYSNVFPIIA